MEISSMTGLILSYNYIRWLGSHFFHTLLVDIVIKRLTCGNFWNTIELLICASMQ